MGGVHLITLARLGIGRFHIADPDRFAVANFNRQYGANTRSLGRNKAKVMVVRAAPGSPLDPRGLQQSVDLGSGCAPGRW